MKSNGLKNDAHRPFRASAGSGQSLTASGTNTLASSDRSLKSFETNCYKSLYPVRTPLDFASRVSDIIGKIGFSAYSFISLTPSPDILFTNLPEALMQTYKKEKFIRDDYALSYGRSTPCPTLRSSIEDYMNAAPMETREMTRNHALSALLKSHGFYDFYLLPLSSSQNRYLFSITTQETELEDFQKNTETRKQELFLLAKLILQISKLKFVHLLQKPGNTPKCIIHPRPLKLLKTLAGEDMDLSNAADKLCISIHTANHHIAAAKKALGTKTTAGTVYRALKFGLMDTTSI